MSRHLQKSLDCSSTIMFGCLSATRQHEIIISFIRRTVSSTFIARNNDVAATLYGCAPGCRGVSTMLCRMKKRCMYTAAVASVGCGSFNMIPTWVIKFTPLLRLWFSVSNFIPSSWEGVRVSSSSVKNHCDCDARRIGFDGHGTGRWSGWGRDDAIAKALP